MQSAQLRAANGTASSTAKKDFDARDAQSRDGAGDRCHKDEWDKAQRAQVLHATGVTKTNRTRRSMLLS